MIRFAAAASLATALLFSTAARAQQVPATGPLVTVEDAANGIVARPGDMVRLAVTATESSGGSLSGATVLFVAPESAAAGTFPASAGPDKTFFRATTSSGGQAEANFVVGNTPGAFVIDAVVEGTSSLASFALTVVADLPETPLSPTAARAQVAADILEGAAEDENLRVHGPFLVPAGTEILPAGNAPAPNQAFPLRAENLSWFFWIDDDPRARFAHPTRYVLLDATDDSGAAAEDARVRSQLWWPEIILPTGRTLYSLASPYASHGGVNGAASNIRATLSEPPPFVNAPADACAIVVYGPNLKGAKADTERFREYLTDNDLVPADNIFMNFRNSGDRLDPNGSNATITKDNLQELINEAAKKNCKKLYLLVSTHGSPSGAYGGGGFSVATSAVSDPTRITYGEFMEMLRPFMGVEFCAILDACYSGQLALWFQGRGFTGAVATAADFDSVSYDRPSGGVFTTAFINALEDSDADTSGDGMVTFQEAVQHLRATSTDSSLQTPDPLSAPIDPTGVRRMSAGDDYIKSPARDLLLIRRPEAVAANSTFVYTLEATDGSIVEFETGGGGVINPGSNLTAHFYTGKTCGITEYIVRGTDASTGQTYLGRARIQVGDFTLDKMVITLQLGEQLPSGQITVSRLTGDLVQDQAAATFTITSRNPNIAVPGILVPIPVAASQMTLNLNVFAVSAGEAVFEVKNETTGSIKTFKVVVLAPPGTEPPPQTGLCPTEGSAEVELSLNQQEGNPNHDPFFFPNGQRKGLIEWSVVNGQFSLTSNLVQLAPILPGNGTFNVSNCTFEGTGNANGAVAGVSNPQAVYSNGQIPGPDFDRIEFDYALGTNQEFPGGLPGVYTGSGQINTTPPGPDTTTILLPPADRFHFPGGDGVVIINVPPSSPWTAQSLDSWIQLNTPNQGTGPGFFQYTVQDNPGSQGRTGTIEVNDQSFLLNQDGLGSSRPLVNSVVNGQTFVPGAGDNAFITVLGQNFSQTTRTWGVADFTTAPLKVRRNQVNPFLPTSLDGLSVTVNGRPAYVQYISPGQINILAENDTAEGDVEVRVSTAAGSSDPAIVPRSHLLPEFFRFNPEGGRYPAAVHPDGTLVGRDGLFQTFTTRAPKPGDIILLYGSGWGPTDPPLPVNRLVEQPAPLVSTPIVTIGGKSAEVLFAGLVASGLAQFNVVIPELPPGDHRLEGFIDGLPIPYRELFLTIGE
jgi:uncharacterized protein (TIGR03437 family)